MPPAPSGADKKPVPASQTRTVITSMLWMAAGGLSLATMNAIMRLMTQQLDSFQSQFLRYAFGLAVVLPIIFRGPIGRLRPSSFKTQIWRGIAQTIALSLFFLALPHVPLADMTAMMFITPMFVLLGAAVFLREKVSLARWLAACVGFVGVVIVLWPHMSSDAGAGAWSLVMLGATPFFAATFLITKAMTRSDSNETLVTWLNISVALMTLPMALWVWQWPSANQWIAFACCGLLGTIAHFCFTQAFSMVDISSLQPVRFLDLIWSSALGLIIFGNAPAHTALLGGGVIIAATIVMSRYEAKRSPAKPSATIAKK